MADDLNTYLSELFKSGKSRGYVTYSELNNLTTKYGLKRSDINKFVDKLNDNNIHLSDDTTHVKPFADHRPAKKYKLRDIDTTNAPSGARDLTFDYEIEDLLNDEEEDRYVSQGDKLRKLMHREYSMYRASVLTQIVMIFYKLLYDYDKSGGKIDNNMLTTKAREAAWLGINHAAAFNKALNASSRGSKGERINIGVSEITSNMMVSECIKMYAYYPKFKQLQKDTDGSIPMEEDFNSKLNYRTVKNINEDTHGYNYTTNVWNGAVCDGKNIIRMSLTGNNAIRAREICKQHKPISLVEDACELDNCTPIDSKIRRGTRVINCIVCGSRSSYGSDYCGKVCEDNDIGDIDSTHDNYQHYES